MVGLGIIVRESKGGALAMQCATRTLFSDPATAEGMAAWTALELSLKLKLRSIILEGDAREVVQILCKEGDCRSKYGQVLNDAKFLLTHVPDWRVKHIRRTANIVAHRLAKMALAQGENKLWKEYPLCISEEARLRLLSQ